MYDSFYYNSFRRSIVHFVMLAASEFAKFTSKCEFYSDESLSDEGLSPDESLSDEDSFTGK